MERALIFRDGFLRDGGTCGTSLWRDSLITGRRLLRDVPSYGTLNIAGPGPVRDGTLLRAEPPSLLIGLLEIRDGTLTGRASFWDSTSLHTRLLIPGRDGGA